MPMTEQTPPGAPETPSELATQPEAVSLSPNRLARLRATVARDLNVAEIHAFVEACELHGFDPLGKQMWPLKIEGQLHIVVSRDGMLEVANRHTPAGSLHVTGDGMYRGCQSDVVREHDYFDKGVDDDGNAYVDHRYRNANDKPTHGGPTGALRGAIVGAYAIVRRLGHADTYFFAYWEEYARDDVWVTHPSAMMQKVPETMALRKAFSLSGVIGETEVHRIAGYRPEGAPAPTPVDPHLGDDPAVAARLVELFDALDYTMRKRLLRTLAESGGPIDDAGRLALIADLEHEAADRGIGLTALEQPEPAAA